MVRVPFSKRKSEQDRAQFAALRDGVPDGLVKTLFEFVMPHLFTHDDFDGRVIPKPDAVNRFARLTDTYLAQQPADAFKQFVDDRTLLLDTVDFVLGILQPDRSGHVQSVEMLMVHLNEARSTYTIGRDRDGGWQLQDRQPAEVSAIVEQVASGSDRASEHLARAWSKLYGRNPDYNTACLEAVAAIEVAAKPVVSPNNTKTTLGTIIRDMKAKPSKWVTDSEADDDVEKVIAMMELVWQGHFRHGDDKAPIEMSPAGAVIVVQTGAVLVGWFQADHIQPA